MTATLDAAASVLAEHVHGDASKGWTFFPRWLTTARIVLLQSSSGSTIGRVNFDAGTIHVSEKCGGAIIPFDPTPTEHAGRVDLETKYGDGVDTVSTFVNDLRNACERANLAEYFARVDENV